MKYDQWKVETLNHSDELFGVGRNVFSDGKFSYERFSRNYDSREKAEKVAEVLNLINDEVLS